jgi:hypothetical protein
MRTFREKFGDLTGDAIHAKLQALVTEFLTHDGTKGEGPKSEFRGQKPDARPEQEELKAR